MDAGGADEWVQALSDGPRWQPAIDGGQLRPLYSTQAPTAATHAATLATDAASQSSTQPAAAPGAAFSTAGARTTAANATAAITRRATRPTSAGHCGSNQPLPAWR